MKRWLFPLSLVLIGSLLSACGDKEPVVTIHTNYGDMKVVLYNQTPEHKESFLRIANDGGYDSTIFHRVIANFMIQGGDRSRIGETKDAEIPFEYVPELFHQKGALAGARMGERSNPERASGTQWYIVQGETFNAEDAKAANQRMQWQSLNTLLQMLMNQEEYSHLRTELQTRNENMAPEEFRSMLFNDPEVVAAITEEYGTMVPEVEYTDEQLETYATVGGTPHLDGGYTVFGQVIEGMEVIDKIAAVETYRRNSYPDYTIDQPKEDIPMYMTVEMMDPKEIEKRYGFVFPSREEVQ